SIANVCWRACKSHPIFLSSASFGPSAVRVITATVYSGRREADLVMTSLRSMEPKIDPVSEPIPEPRRGKDCRGHQSGFDLRGQLYRITGVDLTRIDGIEVQNAQTIVSEVGVDNVHSRSASGFFASCQISLLADSEA